MMKRFIHIIAVCLVLASALILPARVLAFDFFGASIAGSIDSATAALEKIGFRPQMGVIKEGEHKGEIRIVETDECRFFYGNLFGQPIEFGCNIGATNNVRSILIQKNFGSPREMADYATLLINELRKRYGNPTESIDVNSVKPAERAELNREFGDDLADIISFWELPGQDITLYIFLDDSRLACTFK